MDFATIAAIATPLGSGGIGIIRMSGKDALRVAQAVFSPSRNLERIAYRSHRFYHGWVIDPKTNRILDEVLMVYMQAPHSYTREDVVEIHTHSGPAALQAVLELVLRQGPRVAEPGEFTRRAFLNGRIDLTQAEAIIDLVNAKTRASLEVAALQVNGALRKAVEACRNVLLDAQAALTAAIDFPEEAEDAFVPEKVLQDLKSRVLVILRDLEIQYTAGHMLREGVQLVVIGPPNVGKSSLMNRLLQKERAIVSPYPGTTRDFLEEQLDVGGVSVRIVDTAGLQETDDPVERIGIEKTLEKIREADVLLYVTDASQPLEDAIPAGWLPNADKPTILVLNKIDLLTSGVRVSLPEQWRSLPSVSVSALYHQGLDILKETLKKEITQGKTIPRETPIIPNARHKAALDRAILAVEAAVKGLGVGFPVELIGLDMAEALDALGEILGEAFKTDVLDAVFSRFCIGK